MVFLPFVADMWRSELWGCRRAGEADVGWTGETLTGGPCS